MNFDFDEWAELYRTDTAAFEARRQEEIERLIDSLSEPARARLKGLQFRIDMERRRAKTPLGGCIRISAMMWESFAELRDVLNGTTGTASAAPSSGNGGVASHSAQVIEFKHRS
jgi:Protein of unknown function (DUF3135)